MFSLTVSLQRWSIICEFTSDHLVLEQGHGMCFRIPFISGPATVSLTLETRLYCNRPPTELWEGNVYSRVCLSMGATMFPLPMMHWTSLSIYSKHLILGMDPRWRFCSWHWQRSLLWRRNIIILRQRHCCRYQLQITLIRILLHWGWEDAKW